MSDAVLAKIENRADVGRFPGVNYITPRGTEYRSTQIAKWEPDYFELAREGRLFVVSGGVKANGVTPVAADDPGTAAAYVLYNPASSTQVLVPLRVWALVSGTWGAGGGSLMVCNPQTEATAVTANSTGVLVKSTSGSSRSFPGFWATGATLDSAGAWEHVAATPQASANYTSLSADLDGRYIVKPGYAMGAHCLTATGGTPIAVISMLVAVLDAKMFD